MKKITTRLFFLPIFLLFFESLSLAASNTMATGDQRMLHVTAKDTITVTNPKVIKVILEENKGLRIIAKQPGTAKIMATGLNMNVIVFEPKLKGALASVATWAQKIYGITYNLGPQKIYINGTALRLEDWLDLQSLKKRWGPLIASDVIPSPQVTALITNSLNKKFMERSLTSAHAVIHDGSLEVLSSTKNKDERASIDELGSNVGIKKSATTNELELKPMIEIEILITEVKKNMFRTLGLQMPGSYSATIIPSGDLSSASTTFNPIAPEFHALFKNDLGKVLANPRLLCRSGEVAHFVAGGEIPIKMVSWKTQDVIWKRYGVILDITPLADLNDGISTKLVTEISLLDEAHKVDGIPGLLTNRIDTHFDIRGSKTIALSGLIKSELGRNTTGTPLLGEIPILGELFKSNEYKDNRTELVVFVTPRVISPENPPVAPTPSALWRDSDNSL